MSFTNSFRFDLSHRQVWLIGLLLVTATFLAYQPVWHAGFIWDDDAVITKNPVLKSADGLWRPWFTACTVDYYPMTFSLWWLEWRLWADNPMGYHLVNVLLHAVSAILLWRVFLRLNLPGALLAAALFALHPVNVESVAWISEGKNTLAMFFYAGTILAWLKFEDGGGWRSYGVALVAFGLALFSKTATAPLPLILLGIAWWRRGRVGWNDLVRVIPFFVMAAAVSAVTVWFHLHRAMGGEVVRTDGFWSRLAGAVWAVWFYLYKAVLPMNLIFVYPRWQIDPRNALTYLPLMLLVAAFVLCWRWRRGWGRMLFFGLAYFVVMLLPVLGFINIYFMRYSLVADHWQYFAILGPIALAAAVLRRPLVALPLLLALAMLTWLQCRIYSDNELLWRSTLARNPGCTMAQNNLSRAFVDKGQIDEAMSLCQSVLAIRPNDATAQFNLGDCLQHKGRLDEAIAHFQKARELQPSLSGIPYAIGQAYLNKGLMDDAIQYFQKAIELQPDYPVAFCNLGYALLQKGRRTEAQAAYEKALALDPRYALAHNDLGNILLQAGRMDEAMEHFQRAAEIQPDFAEAHFNMAEVLLARGRPAGAISQYEKALEIRPDLAEADYKLGNIFAQQGREAEAVSHYTTALKTKPDYTPACNNLAWLLAAGSDPSLRDGPKAIQWAQRADQLAGATNPVYLGTLAAAYAEAGKFDLAVKTIERALPLAAANSTLSSALEKQKALYQARTPSRQPPRHRGI
ncbi:MAG: tetratricopeptide repeat protein [Verrucomicrobiota bacterium]